MPLKVSVTSTEVTEEESKWFAQCVRLAFTKLAKVRQRLRIPASHIEARLVDDLEKEVREGFQPEYTAGRIGGTRAAAKNLPQSDDESRVLILFDACSWRSVNTLDKIPQLFLAAHELAHPIVSRARFAAGLTWPEGEPGGGRELAGQLCRTLGEEYWADRIADSLVQSLVTAGSGDHAIPVSIWLVRSEAYLQSLNEILDIAYREWPQTVEDYKYRRLGLDALTIGLNRSIYGALTFLTHAQALADSVGEGDFLEQGGFVDIPALRLYLLEPWRNFTEALRGNDLICRPADLAERETAIMRAGEQLFESIWSTLGIRYSGPTDGAYRVDVSWPLRQSQD